MEKKYSDFLSFLKKSITVYHAAEEIARRFKSAGFILLDEGASWKIEPGQGYFLLRGDALVAAFIAPKKIIKSAIILATHIDSPCLKLKPKAETVQSGFSEINTELYGSPLLHTWFDRELIIAGKVMCKAKDGKVKAQTVAFEKSPVLIPSLALHLDRTIGEKGFSVQKQEHLKAIFSLNAKEDSFEKWLHTECKALPLCFDLFLISGEEPKLFGKNQEFLAAARLDNLSSAYAALFAIEKAKPTAHTLQIALFFDHEEIGSVSAQGADSVFAEQLLQRIAIGSGLSQEELYRMKSSSLCISGDVAHGVHPNFMEKYDSKNAPELGGGVVFKFNANQKYATSSLVAAPLMQMAKENKIPVQTFASRSDIASGSTIGSMFAANTGIATIDVGISSLAMHSIRETIAIEDEMHLSKFFYQALMDER